LAGSEAFAKALDQTRSFPQAELSHMLFEVRSRQLRGDLKREDAAAYLSGLIIGQDVSGAKRLFLPEQAGAGRVVVIGSPKLGALYAQALKAHDIVSCQFDGEVAALAGLKALYDVLFHESADHDL
jgi:2-dehydro-3-deoxygalactonokinase